MTKFSTHIHLNTDRIADPLTAGIERFVGLEHIEPENLHISRWGSVTDGTTFTNHFKPGQVLFGKRRAYQRKVAVADFEGVCSSDIYVFESKDPDKLLPKDQPNLKINGIPAFEYAYPVLPSSVITRFIVRMNQKINDRFVWRTDVLLKIGENKALVKADIEDKKITIAIEGLEHTRRDALSAIRYQLDEIHASIKGLNPQKRVPVPNAPNAEALEYDYLLMLEREGQETHLAKDGTRLVKVNVREILSGIESEAKRREIGGNVTNNIFIGGNVSGSNIVSGDNNVITQRIQDSFNKADKADIQAELKETLKELAEAVAAMNKELSPEQATEATDDLEKLVEEATKSKPNKKWYSVSIEGLIQAAENLGKIGVPVISLSKKVLSLLTGGMVQPILID